MYPNHLVHEQLGSEDETTGQPIEYDDQQYFNILIITLRKLKDKRKAADGFRKIG